MYRLLAVVLLRLFSATAAENPYPPGPDSKRQDDTPHGEVIKGSFTAATNSVFPGTIRDYTLYLPPQLDRARRMPLLVLQDCLGLASTF